MLSFPKRDQPECKFDDLAIDVVNRSSQAVRAELPTWVTMQTGHAVQYLSSHTKVLTTANLAPLLSKSLSESTLRKDVASGLSGAKSRSSKFEKLQNKNYFFVNCLQETCM